MAIKIIIGIWDNRNTYNIPDSLADTMLDVTLKFANTTLTSSSVLGHVTEIFTFSNLNTVISTLQGKDYTHFILLSSGCILYNPGLFVNGVCDQILNNPGMCLSAQILHTGLWSSVSNPEFYTLHEQMLLFSKHAVDDMQRDNFIFNTSLYYSTDNWRKIARDSNNVHDDYTPLDIWASPNTELIVMNKPNKFGFFEDVLQYCIKTNWHIQNFNKDIRNSKQYTYHNEQPHAFEQTMNLSLEEIEKVKNTLVKGHYEFFAKMKKSTNIFWGYNTEYVIPKNEKVEYDCFVTLAAGCIPWAYLSSNNFLDNTTVHFIDISEGGIEFVKWFLKNYNPASSYTWTQIVNQFEAFSSFKYQAVGNPEFAEKIWNEYKDKINHKWNKIKQYTYKYNVEDLVTSSVALETVFTHRKPLVWFSNIFRYFPEFAKNYNNDIDLQNFLNRLIKANRFVDWIGISPDNNKQTTGMNSLASNNLKYYKPYIIPKFESETFLKEIQSLEEQNLFTDHRGNNHPGWSSFVLHGLGYNKTLGYENYGYKNDKEAPYDWTNEALQYCPSIVQYFKNSGIKKRYHRLRIMRLAPDGYISIHDDDPHNYKTQWALNIAVNNPDNCEMHFWNDDFEYAGKVPWAPEAAFLIRIHWKHMVMNLSNTIRYHIIVHGEE